MKNLKFISLVIILLIFVSIKVSGEEEKKILVLNSYHHGMTWTDNIEKGIKNELSDADKYNFYIDYMDTIRNNSKEYINSIDNFMKDKYIGKSFDLIILTDNDAFDFYIKYGKTLFGDTPVVFCGINNFEDSSIKDFDNITGLTEQFDVKGTIDIAVKQNKSLKNLVIINDDSTTGRANRSMINQIMKDYNLNFIFYDNINMDDILKDVATLKSDTAILLMTFIHDKSNNTFSYEKVIKLISAKSSVPIYGVWDLYIPYGLLGGHILDSVKYGENVGIIAKRILNGESVNSIPVIKTSLSTYMFDYNMLKKFNIKDSIPEGSIILNKPIPFYIQHQVLLIISTLFLIFLSLVLVFYKKKLKKSQKENKKLSYLATRDSLTNAINRREGIEILDNLIAGCKAGSSNTFSICYMDIDNLKMVNDKFGHSQGDNYILNCCRIIINNIRERDSLCRLGGDEFLLIFPDTDKIAARNIYRRISTDINVFNNTSSLNYQLGLSHGIQEYHKDSPFDSLELIKIADSKMYREKKAKKEAGR